jgi:integrase
MKRRRPWIVSVGGHGHTVAACERVVGGMLYLRWWDPTRGPRGNFAFKSLKHRDRELAESQARQHSALMLTLNDSLLRGNATLSYVLSRYESEVSAHKKGAQPAEDRRRIAIWSRFLGPDRAVAGIDQPTLDRFVRERRAGRIIVPTEDGKTLKLAKNPSDTAIGADLVFLNSALNWATKLRLKDGSRLLADNPMRGYPIPSNTNVRRPVATYDRFLAVRAKADTVDPLFGFFLDLIESLGWRVSAVCQLRASDYDRKATPETPNGRLRKRGEFDKEDVEMWVPLSIDARTAIEGILRTNPTVGEMPLFPARKAKDGKRPASWSRFYARTLLRRAEVAADLEPLEGGDFHPYRRSWATARKDLPTADVMKAGGWKDRRSLENCYQQVDAKTMLAVVSHPAKVRELKEAK